MALPLIHSHVAEKETGQQGAAEVVRTSLGVVASHAAALPHRGKSGTDLKKRQREKNAVEQQAGRETEGGGRRADKRGLTCCAIGQTGAMQIV